MWLAAWLTLLTASPFLRAIVMRKNHSEEWKQLWHRGRIHRIGLWLTFGIRYVIAAATIYYVLDFLSPFRWYFHIAAALVIVLLFIVSRRIKWTSIKLERTFLQNLRSRETLARADAATEPGYAGRLTSRNIHIAELDVPDDSAWAGKRLSELEFSHRDGVMIAAIVRGAHRQNVPGGEAMIFPGDRIEAIGSDDSLQGFCPATDAGTCQPAAFQQPFAVAPRHFARWQCVYRQESAPQRYPLAVPLFGSGLRGQRRKHCSSYCRPSYLPRRCHVDCGRGSSCTASYETERCARIACYVGRASRFFSQKIECTPKVTSHEIPVINSSSRNLAILVV